MEGFAQTVAEGLTQSQRQCPHQTTKWQKFHLEIKITLGIWPDIVNTHLYGEPVHEQKEYAQVMFFIYQRKKLWHNREELCLKIILKTAFKNAEE